MLPVGQTRHDDSLEIFQHRIERLGTLGRRTGKLGAYRTGSGSRLHGVLRHVCTIVGDPVDDAMTKATKLFRCHDGSRGVLDPAWLFTTGADLGYDRARSANSTGWPHE